MASSMRSSRSNNSLRPRDEKTTTEKFLDLKVKVKRHRGTSWLKYIDNIVKERRTNPKEVGDRGLHLNRIGWRKFLTG